MAARIILCLADKTMMVTKDITCNNCDLGTCANGKCTGGAFFRVDQTYRSSSWFFTWLDQDGSVVRHVAPTKAAGPYLIASQPKWWQLNDTTSWQEGRFGGGFEPVWVTPMPATEVLSRIEMRVTNAANTDKYTVGECAVLAVAAGM